MAMIVMQHIFIMTPSTISTLVLNQLQKEFDNDATSNEKDVWDDNEKEAQGLQQQQWQQQSNGGNKQQLR